MQRYKEKLKPQNLTLLKNVNQKCEKNNEILIIKI